MPTDKLEWTRVDKYVMRSGEYIVGKHYDGGDTMYSVNHANTCIKWCADWDEAQKVAQDHAEGKHEQT